MIAHDESKVSLLKFEDWPDYGGEVVEFRVVYSGPLPAHSRGNSHPQIKHQIRRAIHRQLLYLSKQTNTYLFRIANDPVSTSSGMTTRLEMVADNWSRCGYRFYPLINEREHLACSLDILFLRRDSPGSLFKHGGDLDNRIKTLLDALRVPETCEQLNGHAPGPGENPMLCLMEDDKLITEIKIATDRLLIPPDEGGRDQDVHLIIQIKSLRIELAP